MEMATPPPQAAVLAPLDNLLWDHRLRKALFGLDYSWEVYVPVEKRRYGYYVLPVLYGDQFVARFEPGRDKRRGVFIIKNWWWEPGITPDAQMQSALLACFRRFLGYLDLPRLEMDPSLAERLGLGPARDGLGLLEQPTAHQDHAAVALAQVL